jgi:hypothetical protein
MGEYVIRQEQTEMNIDPTDELLSLDCDCLARRTR